MGSKDVLSLKQKIRKRIQNKRRHQSTSKRNKHSLKIWNRLRKTDEFNNARTVMFYLSLPEEVRTGYMIKESIDLGKKILVPFISKKKRKMSISFLKDYDAELEKGFFGILEPKKEYRRTAIKKKADLIIVPGVVFDLKGGRLGFGGGYYDRFLKTLKNKSKIALAYDFQLIKKLPQDLYDVSMDKIITEKRMINCSNKVNVCNQKVVLKKTH